jgi:hypothetical protein
MRTATRTIGTIKDSDPKQIDIPGVSMITLAYSGRRTYGIDPRRHRFLRPSLWFST